MQSNSPGRDRGRDRQHDINTSPNNNYSQQDHQPNTPILKQMLNAYLIDSEHNKDINEMVTILLSVKNSPSLTLSSINENTFNLGSFITFRSQYIGNIDSNNINTVDLLTLNYRLFHAALLTNTPSIIDEIMPYLNFDFTVFNIPLHQIDVIKQMNAFNIDEYDVEDTTDGIHPNNRIFQAIIDTTEKGHYKSIQHLIEKYNLSPTIPIYDGYLYEDFQCTNLLHSATKSNNIEIVEYLLPLCFPKTNTELLSGCICNIASQGHLKLIQKLKDEYNIDLNSIQDRDESSILHYAVKSNNIELIDYLIKDIGIDPDNCSLSDIVGVRQWIGVKHLITQYNADIQYMSSPLYFMVQDQNITIDTIDFIITKFKMNEDPINHPRNKRSEPPIVRCARNNNLIAVKHLIEKYNAKYKLIYTGGSLLHFVISNDHNVPSLEMLEYLYELGLDVNEKNASGLTPIQLIVHVPSPDDKCLLHVFKSLLEHNADIGDINQIIQSATEYGHWGIVQYLIETYTKLININTITTSTGMPLLHHAIWYDYPSLDFITFLLKLPQIDINGQYKRNTPIHYALTRYDLNIDIIK